MDMDLDQDMDAQHPVQQALRNPIVLEAIFKQSSVQGKVLRQVCKTWNEIVLSLPQPKLCLWLRIPNWEPCCDSRHFILFCNTIDPRLARSIKQDLWCQDNDHPEERSATAATTRLNHISRLFSGYVQLLDLTVTDSLIPAMIQMFHNHCPNLRRVTLRCYDFTDEHDVAIDQDGDTSDSGTPSFFPRPNLTTLHFFFQESNSPSAKNLAQLLINSAPSLKNLKVCSHHYPDLGKAINLRSLIITLNPGGDWKFDPTADNFVKADLTRMLHQVAPHLEFLAFGDEEEDEIRINYDDDDEDIDDADFELPEMPKLKHFRNGMIDVFGCGEFLQNIAGDRMKSLRTLEISKGFTKGEDLGYLIECLAIPEIPTLFKHGNSGVTSLTLNHISNPFVLAQLQLSFPYLERLNLEITPAMFDPDGAAWYDVRDYLEACSTLRLAHLSLDVHRYPKLFSDFVESFFHYREMFKTMKTFKISCENRWDHDMEDNLDWVQDVNDKLRRVLLSMIGMESAIFCYVSLKYWTWRRIEPFIKDNNIPVEFRQWN